MHRADVDAGSLQVQQELGGAGVAVGFLVAVAGHLAEQDGVVGAMGVRGPQLAAVDPVAAIDLHRPGAGAGEVGAGVRLAHADAEGQFAGGDFRAEELLLLLGAEAQDIGTALAVAGVVGGQRRAGGEHFLDQHVAFEGAAFVAAILFRPRHADPAALAHRAAEVAVELASGEAHQVLVFLDEFTDFGAHGQRLGRQFDGIEAEHWRGHGRFPTSSC